MSNLDVGSSLRWISASTTALWHHFHFASDQGIPNQGPTWLLYRYRYKGAFICPWHRMSIAQTLCKCLIWMYGMVWGGYLPRPRHYGIISTLRVTLNSPKSGANLAGVKENGCTHKLLRQHASNSNTLNMLNMDVWSGLRWKSASTMRLWHHFYSTSDSEFPNLGPTWPV
jgi:hypothetical protein